MSEDANTAKEYGCEVRFQDHHAAQLKLFMEAADQLPRVQEPAVRDMNYWRDRIHQYAKDKGWWENMDRNVYEQIALMHTELSEAVEALREGYAPEGYMVIGGKPEGPAVELVDCMIRILDTLGRYEVDVNKIMELKQSYNETRPYKHGGKKA